MQILQPAKSVMQYHIWKALITAQGAQEELMERAQRAGWKSSEQLHEERLEEAKSAADCFASFTFDDLDFYHLHGYIQHRRAIDDANLNATIEAVDEL